LIRLIRIVKLYKQQQLLQKKNEEQKHKEENKAAALKSFNKEDKPRITNVHPDSKKGEAIVKKDVNGDDSVTSDSEEDDDLDLDAVDSEDLSDDENDFKVPEESKISKTLSAKTTRTVVILVLILLFLLELCSIDTWVETDIVHQAAIGNMAFLYGLKEPFYPDYLKSIDHFIKLTHDKKAIDYPLVYLQCVQTPEYSN